MVERSWDFHNGPDFRGNQRSPGRRRDRGVRREEACDRRCRIARLIVCLGIMSEAARQFGSVTGHHTTSRSALALCCVEAANPPRGSTQSQMRNITGTATYSAHPSPRTLCGSTRCVFAPLVEELRGLSAHDGAAECRLRPADGRCRSDRAAGRAGASPLAHRAQISTATQRNSQAASASASRSPARWRSNLRCC